MENTSQGNKKAFGIIIVEIVVVIIVVLLLLFIFKFIQLPGAVSLSSSGQKLPLSSRATGVKKVIATYVLAGEVQSITQASDGKYRLILREFPTETFILGKNATVRNQQLTTTILAQNLKPKSKISMGIGYDFLTNKWMEIPDSYKINSIKVNTDSINPQK